MSPLIVRCIPVVALAVLCVLSTDVALADRTDYATFEAFYTEEVGWTKYLVMAAFAIGTGALIFVSGGTAAGPAVGVGTWIGNLMGYSGAAATNAGLALLGGGSIASGGYGIVGGTALLVAALDFTAAVAIDTTVSMVFDRDSFIASMDERSMLPLPIRGGDFPSARASMKVLDRIDRSKPLGIEGREVVKQAIGRLTSVHDGRLNAAETAQKFTLLSVLQLISGDPVAAKRSAQAAYAAAKDAGVKRTMPAALLGIAILYDDRPNFDRSLDLFEYATKYEGGSHVGPAMYLMYFDLLTARADEIPHRYRPWDRLAKFVDVLEYGKPKAVFETMLLARMLMRVKLEQVRTSVLSTTVNCTLRESRRSLDAAERALEQYGWLVSAFNVTAAPRLRYLDHKMATGDADDWEKDWRKDVATMANVVKSYTADIDRLSDQVNVLRIEWVSGKSRDPASICWDRSI